MRLQEVPFAGLGTTAVDYGALFGIGGAFGVTGSRRIETGVVALGDDNNGDVRETFSGLARI